MKTILVTLFVLPAILSFGQSSLVLSQEQAEELANIPLHCIHQEYPNKLNQTLADSSHLDTPASLHPIFYGCFDWHSSVHGHWMLAKVLNRYPDSETAVEIINLFDQQYTVPNVQKELLYFQPKVNQSFERTYGWAWLLKLYEELLKSPENKTHKWTNNLQSLIDQIVKNYKAFLPKLVYPIRVGEHTNTAFGLSFALDYARAVNDEEFETLIVERSKTFYLEDQGCPLKWEPSGFDFLSPCFEEAELMSKVLTEKEYQKWIKSFLPSLFEKKVELKPAEVLDRTDGKLVHLDGLNFSRAWCLYNIGKKLPELQALLNSIADNHVNASIDQVVGSDYMGSHWLASFLLYALDCKSTK